MPDEVAPSPAAVTTAANPPSAAPAASVASAPEPTVAPSASVPAAPVVETPPATPEVVSAPTAPVVEAEPLKPHTDEPTLLEGEAVKPGEEASTPKLEIQPQATVFQAYTLPEGTKLDDARVATFNDLLAKPDLAPQERGQALVNMHIEEMQNYAEFLRREQHRVFSETRADWRKAAMADEEMGGSGWNTSLIAIAKMRDMFVPEDRREAFNNFLRHTGAGDHPEFLRFLRNVARRFDEPAPVQAPYQPPPDIGKRPNGAKRSAMYDHPSSHRNRS